MLLGQLQAEFPWGILLITDEDSVEEIPTWKSDEDQVTRGASTLAVKVLHRDEGAAVVRVWRNELPSSGRKAYEGCLSISSGILRVGTALGESSLRLPVSPGLVLIQVFLDESRHAEQADIVVSD